MLYLTSFVLLFFAPLILPLSHSISKPASWMPCQLRWWRHPWIMAAFVPLLHSTVVSSFIINIRRILNARCMCILFTYRTWKVFSVFIIHCCLKSSYPSCENKGSVLPNFLDTSLAIVSRKCFTLRNLQLF